MEDHDRAISQRQRTVAGDPPRPDVPPPPRGQHASRGPAKVGARILRLIALLALAALVVAGVVGWFTYQFGSFNDATAYLGGERLLIGTATAVPPQRDEPHVRRFTFRIRNRTGGPVRVLGFKPTCACISTNQLPLTVAAGADEELTVAVKLEPHQSRIDETVVFFTDYEEKPRLARRFVVQVERKEETNDSE